jgi:ParB-like chromosome segregation protein Spo0J
MQFHPIADEWPLLDGSAFVSLVASVEKHGVQVPGWLYEGKILDGRNRYRAAEAAGVAMDRWHTFEGTEEEARELARLLNDERRHLTREDRAAWVTKLRAKGMSTRAIADAVGTSRETVRRDLAGDTHVSPAPDLTQEPEPCAPTPTPRSPSSAPSSPASAPASEPPKVTGLDGKKYAAQRPQAKPAPKPEPAAPQMTAGEWAEFFTKLAAVQEFTGTITTKTIPTEMPKWQLLKLLEETARAILATASRLRRSP